VAGEDLIATRSMHDPVGVRCAHDVQVLRHSINPACRRPQEAPQAKVGERRARDATRPTA
jgi:hypothetical protein